MKFSTPCGNQVNRISLQPLRLVAVERWWGSVSWACRPRYPQLRWISIVEQDHSETRTAVHTMNRHLLLAALGILVVTIVLAIYLAIHGKMEITDIAESTES